jgi:hypothetical protein
MHVSGHCHCGAIRYEAEVDPKTVGVCHCNDCQVLSGSAFRVSVFAALGSFQLLQGVPRVYTKTAESGRLREQAFCEVCGSQLYAVSPGPEPRLYSLRVGTIEQRAQLAPQLQIWTRSQLPWAGEIASLPSLEKNR